MTVTRRQLITAGAAGIALGNTALAAGARAAQSATARCSRPARAA